MNGPVRFVSTTNETIPSSSGRRVRSFVLVGARRIVELDVSKGLPQTHPRRAAARAGSVTQHGVAPIGGASRVEVRGRVPGLVPLLRLPAKAMQRSSSRVCSSGLSDRAKPSFPRSSRRSFSLRGARSEFRDAC